MARVAETDKCDAFVAAGSGSSGGMMRCRLLGNGLCLKDKYLDQNYFEHVDVVTGTCKADIDAEITRPPGIPDIVSDVRERGGPGINAFLDTFLEEENKPDSEGGNDN